jgi:hypothetical protein
MEILRPFDIDTSRGPAQVFLSRRSVDTEASWLVDGEEVPRYFGKWADADELAREIEAGLGLPDVEARKIADDVMKRWLARPRLRDRLPGGKRRAWNRR